METNATNLEENNTRTRRVKKPKCIEDLGFVEKNKKKEKKGKTIKILNNCESENRNEFIFKFQAPNSKVKVCHKIFEQFQKYEDFNKFSLFNNLEKQICLGQFQHHTQLAEEIRNIFGLYFKHNINDPQAYSRTTTYSNYFEDLYKEYENKKFNKETKNVLELKKKMNKLRKEIREKNNPNINNKLKINLEDFNLFSERNKKISKKYKLLLANNIRNLNSDQVKGIINIIHDSLNYDNEKTMEIDINKLPIEKLKELDKYVKRCVKNKNRNVNLNSSADKNNYNDKINVNININNNFMMAPTLNTIENTKQNIILTESEVALRKRSSILTDSDSLSSSEEDSGINIKYLFNRF